MPTELLSQGFECNVYLVDDETGEKYLIEKKNPLPDIDIVRNAQDTLEKALEEAGIRAGEAFASMDDFNKACRKFFRKYLSNNELKMYGIPMRRKTVAERRRKRK